MEKYARYYVRVMERAEKHARWIREKGDSRTHWRQIIWNDIAKWNLDSSDKRRLYDCYIKKVEELAPIIITKTAPTKPRIAVSSL